MIERLPFDSRPMCAALKQGHALSAAWSRTTPLAFIFEDDETIIFLRKYPTLPGYCLVSPKEHREDLARDISTDEYLRLQEKVHILSRALKRVFDAERIYVLSLGSQQANSHLHFHVVPATGRRTVWEAVEIRSQPNLPCLVELRKSRILRKVGDPK